jgi:hypothetical protein
MEHFFDILKITLPSLLMLIMVYYLMGGFFRNSEKQQKLKVIRGNQKLITPIRLQAYERLVLLLERISPDSLVMRADYPAKTCKQLHMELLQTIRAEYEHNLAQQLYVSIETWNSVRSAKNYSIALINNAVKGMEDETPAIELSRRLIDMSTELGQPVIEKAINDLKREIQQIF